MSNEELISIQKGAVGVLTLNRPHKRNALSASLMSELAEAVTSMDRDPSVGAIVLTGADPAFTAGFDLKNLAAELGATRVLGASGDASVGGLLPPHDTVVIGAVNGPAVTGGLELALSCDFLIASTRAAFADTHARVGVMPGGGMTVRLPQLIGPDRARRMSLTGNFIDAATAYAWGLVTEVVDHDHLVERAIEIASAIASIDPAPVSELRRMYDEIGALSAPEGFARERAWNRQWMRERFDAARLAATADAIIERGSRQT